MAIIKSFTDLEQSKKLAEILPLESADMMYSLPMLTQFKNYGDADNEQELPDYMVINVRRNIINSSEFDEPIPIRREDIPCWSLAALRNLLPPAVKPNKDSYLFLFESHNTFDKSWVYRYYNEDDTSYLYYKNTNEVDACYDMIIKLHELNLL